ncbi:M-phase inducer phosphatase-like isoform X2 [Hetaerina americana]|uniref:M-phase inducer phosphatase-like isoform X2 n=1 Tax=Hetaerina americana TaxID=62018 RepID=UPI003A7F47FE
MSRIKKDQTKFCVEATDSPMFPGMNHYINSAANSPVSDLAQNLSGAYLGSTPRRRVIESASPAPVKTKHHQPFDLIDSGSAADLPLSENRIQKQSPKNSAGKAATGPLATRNRVIPWRLGPCHGNYDKENISAAAEGSNVTTTAHDASSILSHINSPPPKRLGHVLISPLKPRHPLEDYDPNSQDSGFGNSVPEGEEFRGLENSPSLRAKLASSGFHIEASKNAKVEEHSRFVHQNEKFEISRQISITSTSSVDESPLTSPSRPLAHSQQSNSATPGKKGSPHRSPRSLWSNSKYRSPLRHSHSSGAESIDDGFLEIFELEKASVESSEAPTLPAGIGNLLSKPIVRSSEVSSGPKPQLQNPTFRRCISLVETIHTPPSSRARLCLFRDTKQTKSEEKENSEEISPGAFGFKRPEPPEGFYTNARGKKRRCMTLSQTPECDSPSLWGNESSLVEKVSTPPVLQRSVSDSEAAIKHALFRSSLDPDLIGDFTRPYSLPLIPGRHQDLKTITSDTLAGLLHGKFGDCVDSYSIIDCRYPYEYEGGHIKGAKNLFTHEQILKEFINNREETTSHNSSKSEGGSCKDKREGSELKSIKRDILVFHCEFSSERGPRLSRFLRNSDRDRNKECYPALHYPEIYLLHGGYKEFFDKHSDLCEPCSYLPMADPRYESDLRTCRAKSKSWTGGVGTSGMEGSRMAMRGSLKRLGL